MTKQKSGRRLIVQILCALLLLALLVTTLLLEISRSSESYSLESAQLTTLTVTDTLSGYIFRDEIAPLTTENGPIRYLAQDGAGVSAGQVLAEVFRDDTGTDKRERAAALMAEIETLQAALVEGSDWKTDYVSGYAELMRNLSNGNTDEALDAAQALGTALGTRDMQHSAEADAARARIVALQQQLDELVKHVDAPTPVSAGMDGIFYHYTDGYEALFGTAVAQSLTPEGLSTLLLSATADKKNSIGKLVGNGAWYLAVPTTAENAATYQTQQSYLLHLEGADAEMTLQNVTRSANGTQALLLFYAPTLPHGLSLSRKQTVCIEKAAITGLSIPACAVTAEGTVYIAENGVAKQKHLAPLYTDKGCLLVEPDLGEGFLRTGDAVIVSTRQLFEGKVLE